MESEQTPSSVVASEFDAYGDQVQSGSQSYSYDALGRVAADAGGGQSWAFSYDGASSAVASDGVSDYTWDPSGSSLVGTGPAGGSSGSGALVLTDQHGDVTGDFSASAASLGGSQAFDPWGDVTATTGTLLGQLGFQSGWTDPGTGKVAMGARWYAPSAGGFTSRDTVVNSPVPDSASASPFGYVGDDPLGAGDPTGHSRSLGNNGGGSKPFDPPPPAPSPPPPAPSCGGWFSCGWDAVSSTVSHAYHKEVHRAEDLGKKVIKAARTEAKKAAAVARKAAARVVRDVAPVVEDAAAWGAVVTAFDDVGSATARVYHKATAYAKKAVLAQVHLVATAYHAARRVATATANFVRHHAAAIAAIVVSVAVMAGCEATLGAVTAGAATPVCGALSGAAGNAASYAVTAAQSGKFSWSGLGETAAEGAVAGLVGDGLGEIAGAASGLLSSGADAAASAVSEGASGEVTQAAEETAGEDAAQAGEDADPASCPTEGGESFTAATRVLLASGKTVPISQLKAGDKVKAVDTTTGKAQVKTVQAVLVHYDTDLYDLTVKTARGTEAIDTTSNHLFWDPARHRWVKAASLRVGERLLTANGTPATADGGHAPASHNGWMWDLTIQDDHDFYVVPAQVQSADSEGTYNVVSSDEPVLVHNCGGSVVGHPSSCECADGGVPKVRNGGLAGSEHPVTGVPFDENGFPDFSASRHPDVPDVRIEPPGVEARTLQERTTRPDWRQRQRVTPGITTKIPDSCSS